MNLISIIERLAADQKPNFLSPPPVSATNESDQTKNLMILKFKDGPAEQALVRSEAPRRKASQ